MLPCCMLHNDTPRLAITRKILHEHADNFLRRGPKGSRVNRSAKVLRELDDDGRLLLSLARKAHRDTAVIREWNHGLMAADIFPNERETRA